MLKDKLLQFGLLEEKCKIEKLGSGLINFTWKIDTGDKQYVLQKINHEVFKTPEIIDNNLKNLKHFLNKFHPNYLFVAPLSTSDGKTLIKSEDGYYRLSEYIKDSVTLNYVNTAEEAFEAAKQFGEFSYLLSEFNLINLEISLPNFHNLTLRYTQFEEACKLGNSDRIKETQEEINQLISLKYIVETYKTIVKDELIPLRVIHHDTKISNVLFDEYGKGLCVIDLDTVMPGYYISDVGDMMRTYLSPANEEEKDLSKVLIRKDIFRAIYEGYMDKMGKELNKNEKFFFIYSGEFLIYMQALRFLTDYLNNDTYYGSAYLGHNLMRAKNQIKLLKEYIAAEKDFEEIINSPK
jgi:Ser/Thr protein kinase RdoA (MazF antagonist)